MVCQFRKTCGQVDRTDNLVTDTWLDPAFPSCDEWCACATFINTVFATGVLAAGAVLADLFDRSIFVSVVQYWPIVTAQNNQSVFCESKPIERRHQLANAPIKFDDRIAAEAVSRPVAFGEVYATLFRHLGIDVGSKTVTDLNGRPQYLVEDQAQPLPELVNS